MRFLMVCRSRPESFSLDLYVISAALFRAMRRLSLLQLWARPKYVREIMETTALPSVPSAGPTDVPGTSLLENMPPEIRFEILKWLFFTSLRSLVRVSPCYYATYLRNRVSLGLVPRGMNQRLLTDALGVLRASKFIEDRQPREARGRFHMANYELRSFVEGSESTLIHEYRRLGGDKARPDLEWLSCRSRDETAELTRMHELVKLIVVNYCR